VRQHKRAAQRSFGAVPRACQANAVESCRSSHYAWFMRSWATWYRNLFVAWAILGLPSIVIGYGMGGGDLTLPGGDFLSVTVWVVVSFFLLSPVLLWRWREDSRKQGL